MTEDALMHRILLVAPDAWVTSAMKSLDRTRHAVEVVDYEDAHESLRRAPVEKIVVGTVDMGRASQLIDEIARLPARPVIVAVGARGQEQTFERHATLRRRADAYLIGGGSPADLVRAIEETALAPDASARRWRSRDVATLALLAIVLLVGPALEGSGHGRAAWLCALAAAVIGLVSNALQWRRGVARAQYFALVFLALLVLSLGWGIRAYGS